MEWSRRIQLAAAISELRFMLTTSRVGNKLNAFWAKSSTLMYRSLFQLASMYLRMGFFNAGADQFWGVSDRGLHPLKPLWLSAPAAVALSVALRVVLPIELVATMSQYAEIDGFAYTLQAERPR